MYSRYYIYYIRLQNSPMLFILCRLFSGKRRWHCTCFPCRQQVMKHGSLCYMIAHVQCLYTMQCTHVITPTRSYISCAYLFSARFCNVWNTESRLLLPFGIRNGRHSRHKENESMECFLDSRQRFRFSFGPISFCKQNCLFAYFCHSEVLSEASDFNVSPPLRFFFVPGDANAAQGWWRYTYHQTCVKSHLPTLSQLLLAVGPIWFQ